MSKVLLKAETHQGKIELPMTDKRALAFAKKLFANHKKEHNLYWYGTEQVKKSYWGKYKKIGHGRIPCQGAKPFIKIEFERIEA
jgi:hypothetical protein